MTDPLIARHGSVAVDLGRRMFAAGLTPTEASHVAGKPYTSNVDVRYLTMPPGCARPGPHDTDAGRACEVYGYAVLAKSPEEVKAIGQLHEHVRDIKLRPGSEREHAWAVGHVVRELERSAA